MLEAIVNLQIYWHFSAFLEAAKFFFSVSFLIFDFFFIFSHRRYQFCNVLSQSSSNYWQFQTKISKASSIMKELISISCQLSNLLSIRQISNSKKQSSRQKTLHASADFALSNEVVNPDICLRGENGPHLHKGI